jgi:hypothetical protein
VIGLLFFSCSNGPKSEVIRKGKDLNLQYEILSKKDLFPHDRVDFYSGHLVVDIPKMTSYIDIAESVRAIGLKENLGAAKIFISRTGYLMEVDSIPRNYSEYFKSFFGYYDLSTKAANWKYRFKITDIHFKDELPLKLDM